MPRTAKQRVSAPRRDLSAILDTPLPYARELQAKACGCAGCRRRRARPRTCKVCGYHGPFVVSPCICVSPEEIKARAFVLRELESAGAEESATLVRQRLAELLAGDRCPCCPGT